MELNNSVSLGTNFQENYKASTEGGPTTGCKVASGIFIPLFFLVGVPGNFHVLQVLRRSEHVLNQVTKWTLAHLAIFDLMSCLMNFPMLLAIATGGYLMMKQSIFYKSQQFVLQMPLCGRTVLV